MMTDRELMQQALDALTAYDGTNGANQRKRVLAALRDRLAQPNEFEPDWDQVEALQESLREHMAEIHRLRAALEQEPVCDKDPQGCWNVRCQLGKVCKHAALKKIRDDIKETFGAN